MLYSDGFFYAAPVTIVYDFTITYCHGLAKALSSRASERFSIEFGCGILVMAKN